MSAKWDDRFLALASDLAAWSKDESRKVGCIIVDPDHDIVTVGYNGFPRGVNDDAPERHERPAKYQWTEHAERNAVYNVARRTLKGCTAYLPWFPCMDCARALAQSGISELVCGQRPDLNDPKWGADFANVPALLAEAGVQLRFAEGPAQEHDEHRFEMAGQFAARVISLTSLRAPRPWYVRLIRAIKRVVWFPS